MRRFQNPVWLRDIGKARLLLEEVKSQLKTEGLDYVVFDKHGEDKPIVFDIIDGLSVYDHGQKNPDVRCIACPGHPQLQYEFRITDLEGTMHSPIGSICILKRSLGEDRAAEFGKRLQEAARAHFRPKLQRAKPSRPTAPGRPAGASPVESPVYLNPNSWAWKVREHETVQRQLRAAAGGGRQYLTDLGLGWLGPTPIQPDKYCRLEGYDREAVHRVIEQNGILSINDLARFRKLDAERNANIESGLTVKVQMQQARLAEAEAIRRVPPAPGPNRPALTRKLGEVKPRQKELTTSESVTIVCRVVKRQLREQQHLGSLQIFEQLDDQEAWISKYVGWAVTKARRFTVPYFATNELSVITEALRKMPDLDQVVGE